MVFESDYSLLIRTGVQFVVFCPIIKMQVIFKMLFALITGQLAIVGQLGRKIYL